MLLMLSSGQLLTNVHSDEECLGVFCPIHNPSQHTLREYPLSFSGTHFYRILPDNSLRVDPDDYLLNKNGYAILINALRCPECFDYIESKNQHDFVKCSCDLCFVDGGHTYIRRSESGIDCSQVEWKENNVK